MFSTETHIHVVKYLMANATSEANIAVEESALDVNRTICCYCPPCGQGFYAIDELKYHRYMVHGEVWQHRCSHCGEEFSSLQLLIFHDARCPAQPRIRRPAKPADVDSYGVNNEKRQGQTNCERSGTPQNFRQSKPSLPQTQVASWPNSPPETPIQSASESCKASSGEKNITESPNSLDDSSSSPKTDILGEVARHDVSSISSLTSCTETPINVDDGSILPILAAAPTFLRSEEGEIMVQALEGSKGMEMLPHLLMKKLEEHCEALHDKIPEFVRQKWPSATLVAPLGYSYSIFVDPWQCQSLKAARYTLGKSHQIVVVDWENIGMNESDTCAITTFERSVHLPGCDQNITVQQWQTWRIGRLFADTYGTILRLCFRETASNVAYHISIIIDEWCKKASQHGSATHGRRQSGSSSAEPELIRSQDNGGNEGSVDGSAERKRYFTRNTRSRISDKGFEAEQKESAKVFRVSDQAMVRLCCVDCGRKNIKTVAGMKSHCLAKHGRRFEDKQELADLCGIVLRGQDKSSWTPDNEIEGGSPTTTSSKALVNPLKRKRSQNSRNDPLIVFRNELNSKKQRIRPFSCCQGVDRFFAHAQVAGTADRSTLILSVQVGEGETIQVVREDEEDFNEVMDAVNKVARDDGQQIVVTSASLYN